jgi:parvulin-like peptidyl-prolyl isomerase
MKLFVALFLLIPILSFSQLKIDKQLDSISTFEDAKSYIKNNKSSKGKLITFNTEKHKTKLAKELFELSVGSKTSYEKENGKTFYKLISKDNKVHYKVSIIEFDSNKTPLSEINSLRAFILKGIKSGKHKFENLARVYSAHPSGKTGGDLGWQKAGSMSTRFEKTLKSKKPDRVFIFDEHRQKKHYVMLKTDDDKLIEEITVLKITESK